MEENKKRAWVRKHVCGMCTLDVAEHERGREVNRRPVNLVWQVNCQNPLHSSPHFLMKPNQALSLKTLPPDLERLLPIFFFKTGSGRRTSAQCRWIEVIEPTPPALTSLCESSLPRGESLNLGCVSGLMFDLMPLGCITSGGLQLIGDTRRTSCSRAFTGSSMWFLLSLHCTLLRFFFFYFLSGCSVHFFTPSSFTKCYHQDGSLLRTLPHSSTTDAT